MGYHSTHVKALFFADALFPSFGALPGSKLGAAAAFCFKLGSSNAARNLSARYWSCNFSLFHDTAVLASEASCSLVVINELYRLIALWICSTACSTIVPSGISFEKLE